MCEHVIVALMHGMAGTSVVTHLFFIHHHSCNRYLHWANGNKRGAATVLKGVTGWGQREEDLEGAGGWFPASQQGK